MLPVDEAIPTFEKLLRGCGYGDAHLAMPFDFAGVSVPIAAFAAKPWDSWSACLTVVPANGDSREAARKVHSLGAPTTFVYGQDGVDWWGQGAEGPKPQPRKYSWETLGDAIDQYKDELRPDRIYGAKLNKPGSGASQLWFFDAGLMPAVENDRGRTMNRLVTRSINGLRKALGSHLKDRQAQEDMYRTVFWLLAAKILHDKRVPSFIRIDLKDVADVFDRIGRHYGDTSRLPPFGKTGRPAIDAAAHRIATCGSLRDVSSESLAYIYENTLIDSAAGKNKGSEDYDIRKVLGIHATPSVLVNHILSQLWPAIQEIAAEDCHIFEPACGHAPFLTSAMRWLRSRNATPHYLRTHLHGLEADPFSRELARLSLTLADEPHGNFWLIDQGDMFEPGVLAEHAAGAHVLLANPPYEPFSPEQRAKYSKLGQPVTATTQAVEMINRTIPHLPPGGVFGVVMPQGFLHDKESRTIRRFVLEQCELMEIAVFADKLFEQGEHEVAVLLGQRRAAKAKSPTLMYRRVRELGMEAFKERQLFSTEREVPQARLAKERDATLLLPDLLEIWDYCRLMPKLREVTDIHKGFEFVNRERLAGRNVVSDTEHPGWVKAALRIDDYNIWSFPKVSWVDLDPKNIGALRSASVLGVPQLVVNYARVSRDFWRLKATIDEEGIAVSSRFLVFRPTTQAISIRMLWAVLNSPVANAYAYSGSGKREILVGEWQSFPIPTVSVNTRKAIEVVVDRYFAAAQSTEGFMMAVDRDAVRRALLAVDAEVLKLYDLPPRLERELLDCSRRDSERPKRNVRKGVGCDFGSYFPPEFRPCIPLHEYLSEAYLNSTAGMIVKNFQPVRSKAALDALDFADDLARKD